MLKKEKKRRREKVFIDFKFIIFWGAIALIIWYFYVNPDRIGNVLDLTKDFAVGVYNVTVA